MDFVIAGEGFGNAIKRWLNLEIIKVLTTATLPQGVKFYPNV